MSGFAINRIILSGNLTRDPELKSLQSGTAVCNLGLANNTRRKNGDAWEDKPNFFNVTVWSGMGEWVAKNLSKGDRVVVEGRIEWRQYEKDGQKVTAYDVIADSVVPAGGNGGGRASSEPDLGVEQLPPEAQAQMATPAAGNGRKAGTLPETIDNLKAHCICQPGASANADCPIEGHGIPFRRLAIPDFETRRRDLFVGDRWLA